MKLEPTDGGFVIAAIDLGPLLGLSAEDVQPLMRDGKITSRFEQGQDEDAGRLSAYRRVPKCCIDQTLYGSDDTRALISAIFRGTFASKICFLCKNYAPGKNAWECY